MICVAGIGDRKGFGCLIANMIPSIDLAFEKTQCFPFYTYDEDGINRRENITDWALEHFREYYQDDSITKWTSFIMFMACSTIQNTGSGIRRISSENYRAFHSHRNFGDLPNRGKGYRKSMWAMRTCPNIRSLSSKLQICRSDWRVEKMRLSKDKTPDCVQRFLDSRRDSPKALAYRLGNRSALEWIIDQYRVKEDKRSGIINDPTARTIRNTSSN